jgi:hypothetical protein
MRKFEAHVATSAVLFGTKFEGFSTGLRKNSLDTSAPF